MARLPELFSGRVEPPRGADVSLSFPGAVYVSAVACAGPGVRVASVRVSRPGGPVGERRGGGGEPGALQVGLSSLRFCDLLCAPAEGLKSVVDICLEWLDGPGEGGGGGLQGGGEAGSAGPAAQPASGGPGAAGGDAAPPGPPAVELRVTGFVLSRAAFTSLARYQGPVVTETYFFESALQSWSSGKWLDPRAELVPQASVYLTLLVGAAYASIAARKFAQAFQYFSSLASALSRLAVEYLEAGSRGDTTRVCSLLLFWSLASKICSCRQLDYNSKAYEASLGFLEGLCDSYSLLGRLIALEGAGAAGGAAPAESPESAAGPAGRLPGVARVADACAERERVLRAIPFQGRIRVQFKSVLSACWPELFAILLTLLEFDTAGGPVGCGGGSEGPEGAKGAETAGAAGAAEPGGGDGNLTNSVLSVRTSDPQDLPASLAAVAEKTLQVRARLSRSCGSEASDSPAGSDPLSLGALFRHLSFSRPEESLLATSDHKCTVLYLLDAILASWGAPCSLDLRLAALRYLVDYFLPRSALGGREARDGATRPRSEDQTLHDSLSSSTKSSRSSTVQAAAPQRLLPPAVNNTVYGLASTLRAAVEMSTPVAALSLLGVFPPPAFLADPDCEPLANVFAAAVDRVAAGLPGYADIDLSAMTAEFQGQQAPGEAPPEVLSAVHKATELCISMFHMYWNSPRHSPLVLKLARALGAMVTEMAFAHPDCGAPACVEALGVSMLYASAVLASDCVEREECAVRRPFPGKEGRFAAEGVEVVFPCYSRRNDSLYLLPGPGGLADTLTSTSSGPEEQRTAGDARGEDAERVEPAEDPSDQQGASSTPLNVPRFAFAMAVLENVAAGSSAAMEKIASSTQMAVRNPLVDPMNTILGTVYATVVAQGYSLVFSASAGADLDALHSRLTIRSGELQFALTQAAVCAMDYVDGLSPRRFFLEQTLTMFCVSAAGYLQGAPVTQYLLAQISALASRAAGYPFLAQKASAPSPSPAEAAKELLDVLIRKLGYTMFLEHFDAVDRLLGVLAGADCDVRGELAELAVFLSSCPVMNSSITALGRSVCGLLAADREYAAAMEFLGRLGTERAAWLNAWVLSDFLGRVFASLENSAGSAAEGLDAPRAAREALLEKCVTVALPACLGFVWTSDQGQFYFGLLCARVVSLAAETFGAEVPEFVPAVFDLLGRLGSSAMCLYGFASSVAVRNFHSGLRARVWRFLDGVFRATGSSVLSALVRDAMQRVRFGAPAPGPGYEEACAALAGAEGSGERRDGATPLSRGRPSEAERGSTPGLAGQGAPSERQQPPGGSQGSPGGLPQGLVLPAALPAPDLSHYTDPAALLGEVRGSPVPFAFVVPYTFSRPVAGPGPQDDAPPELFISPSEIEDDLEVLDASGDAAGSPTGPPGGALGGPGADAGPAGLPIGLPGAGLPIGFPGGLLPGFSQPGAQFGPSFAELLPAGVPAEGPAKGPGQPEDGPQGEPPQPYLLSPNSFIYAYNEANVNFVLDKYPYGSLKAVVVKTLRPQSELEDERIMGEVRQERDRLKHGARPMSARPARPSSRASPAQPAPCPLRSSPEICPSPAAAEPARPAELSPRSRFAEGELFFPPAPSPAPQSSPGPGPAAAPAFGLNVGAGAGLPPGLPPSLPTGAQSSQVPWARAYCLRPEGPAFSGAARRPGSERTAAEAAAERPAEPEYSEERRRVTALYARRAQYLASSTSGAGRAAPRGVLGAEVARQMLQEEGAMLAPHASGSELAGIIRGLRVEGYRITSVLRPPAGAGGDGDGSAPDPAHPGLETPLRAAGRPMSETAALRERGGRPGSAGGVGSATVAPGLPGAAPGLPGTASGAAAPAGPSGPANAPGAPPPQRRPGWQKPRSNELAKRFESREERQRRLEALLQSEMDDWGKTLGHGGGQPANTPPSEAPRPSAEGAPPGGPAEERPAGLSFDSDDASDSEVIIDLDRRDEEGNILDLVESYARPEREFRAFRAQAGPEGSPGTARPPPAPRTQDAPGRPAPADLGEWDGLVYEDTGESAEDAPGEGSSDGAAGDRAEA